MRKNTRFITKQISWKKVIKGIAELPEKIITKAIFKISKFKNSVVWKVVIESVRRNRGFISFFYCKTITVWIANVKLISIKNHMSSQTILSVRWNSKLWCLSKNISNLKRYTSSSAALQPFKLIVILSVTPYPWPSEGASELLGWQLISIFL